MVERSYLDTSIWMDLYEDRTGYWGEPLGDYAFKLISLIKATEAKIVISDYLLRELQVYYSEERIRGMFLLFEKILERISVTNAQRKAAKIIAESASIPVGDAIHAVLSRDNNLLLVTRDNHFRKLDCICRHHKPEELIGLS